MTFGVLIDQTGNNAEFSWISVAELAVLQMNEALQAEGGYKNFRFALNVQNSENDVAGGYDSRAMGRLRDIAASGAFGSIVDTTQVSEESNKPINGPALGLVMQCSSCTGGSFLNATSTVADNPDLQASRRNADHWMQRTIMNTGSLAIVVAQMIYGMPNHGDLNGDGIIKLAAFASDESFGQSTSLAAITELKKKFTAQELIDKVRFERVLHVNANDLREIPFAAHLEQLNNSTNENMPPSSATFGATNINAHLFGTAFESQVTDGAPDLIAEATFARNGVQFVTDFKTQYPGSSTKIIHFHTFRFSSNLLPLGELAEGEFGASHAIIDGEPGEMFKAAFKEQYGLLPVYRDSIYYDNAVTMMLATLIALSPGHPGYNPDLPATGITGAMVKEVFPCTSTNAARLITTRPELVCPEGAPEPIVPSVDGFRLAVRTIAAGLPIEYTGASGPIDYDALGNVKGKVASYQVVNGTYEDTALFDCIASATCACTEGIVNECPDQTP
ncbi:MAG: hypothetical protein ACAI38_20535 [Myxococcota bacterium]